MSVYVKKCQVLHIPGGHIVNVGQLGVMISFGLKIRKIPEPTCAT